MTNEASEKENSPAEIGRNEPCPCGSGKKYKRCHGVSAAPKLSQPKHTIDPAMLGPDGLGGIDPQWMQQFSSAMQRLPKGQLQKMQSMMQRAMAGKDVSREAAEFEKNLPPDFMQLLQGFQMPPGMMAAMQQAQGGAPAETAPAASMSEDDARKIVEQAVAEGRLSKDEASKLLGGEAAAPAELPAPSESTSASGSAIDAALPKPEAQGSGLGKFWGKLTGGKK